MADGNAKYEGRLSLAQVPTPPPNASNNTRQTPVKQSSRLQKTSSNADTLTKDELWRLVVWPYLQQKGWTFVAGSTTLHDWSYLRPGKKKSDGTRGVDYFEGWASTLEAVTSDGMLQKQDVKDATAQALRAKQGKGKGKGKGARQGQGRERERGESEAEGEARAKAGAGRGQARGGEGGARAGAKARLVMMTMTTIMMPRCGKRGEYRHAHSTHHSGAERVRRLSRSPYRCSDSHILRVSGN